MLKDRIIFKPLKPKKMLTDKYDDTHNTNKRFLQLISENSPDSIWVISITTNIIPVQYILKS